MKISITADLHLTTRAQHPERFNAFDNMLRQTVAAGIEWMILAGDAFDEISQNYSEFENLCRSADYRHVNVLLLPGNHDLGVQPRMFTADNIDVVTEPRLFQPVPETVPLLLVPYAEGKTMGEFIAQERDHLTENNWILIGHGDWMDGSYEPDPSEPGVYMPLTRTDIAHFQPLKAFLGHIHKPMDSHHIVYLGSPCAIAMNELGRRRFVILDLKTAVYESHYVNTDMLYFAESFVVLPVKNEFDHIKHEIDQRITAWRLMEEEKGKAIIHTKIRGFTSDKNKLDQVFRQAFEGFTLSGGEADFSAVSLADDVNRSEIANLVSDWIHQLDWAENDFKPSKQDILLSALFVIYGE